jgi:hypothetical protein
MRAEDGAPGFVAVRLRLIGRFVGLGGLAFGIEKRISPLSLDFARDSVGMMVLGRERERQKQVLRLRRRMTKLRGM